MLRFLLLFNKSTFSKCRILFHLHLHSGQVGSALSDQQMPFVIEFSCLSLQVINYMELFNKRRCSAGLPSYKTCKKFGNLLQCSTFDMNEEDILKYWMTLGPVLILTPFFFLGITRSLCNVKLCATVSDTVSFMISFEVCQFHLYDTI